MTDRHGSDQPTGLPFVALVVMEAVTDQADPAEGPLTRRTSSWCTRPTSVPHASGSSGGRGTRDAETSYLDDRRQTVGRRLKAVVDVREAEDTDLTEDADLYTRRFRDWAAYERIGPLLSRDDDPA
ncbi:hypothetical protein OQI_11505 [Streptomyces pharetrae CZA14]|uniref:Transposase n=1 Tax=Streptomyces pharetrae CZA14 TaxID=1144883 RepID=A0ABX3YK46_9ACTN|nr:hypothetical protein OQI_11505 [Streptomyces pharetrae CZA14]